MERWLPVVGYEGRYEVSDLGRVRSVPRVVHTRARWGAQVRHYPSKILSHHLNKGYPMVRLGGGGPTVQVHVLVLEAHVGPRPPGFEACHGDGVRDNNALTNLRWASRKENQADRIRHGTDQFGERNATAKLTWAQVDEMRALSATGVSQRVLAANFGVHVMTVNAIVHGRVWRKGRLAAHV